MSFEIYAEAVELGLEKTKSKLEEIKTLINGGALNGEINRELIKKIGRFQGEFTYYTAKELDELVEYCEFNGEVDMETLSIIQNYQKQLDDFEKEYESFMKSRPPVEINNLNDTLASLIKKKAS